MRVPRFMQGALAGLTILALAAGRPVDAATRTEVFQDLTATISAPDDPTPGDFAVDVLGVIDGGSAFSIHAFAVWQDAQWSYDTHHRVSVASGRLIDASGFGWGDVLSRSYSENEPAGTYRYTFVFGQRSTGHGWYDVAVDLAVTVEPAASRLCDTGWRPPLTDRARAGSMVPLKFVAYDCSSGQLHRDESVTVTVTDSDGTRIGSWSYTGNPHTGIDIGEDQYHVNWDSGRARSGVHTIAVQFGTGEVLTRQIDLR